MAYPDDDPEFRPPDADELAWQAAADADFFQWQEEFQRRVLAGEFADDADPFAADPPPGAIAQSTVAIAPRAAPDLPEASPDTDDWWAQADRAVDHADRALQQAEQAVARAGYLVRTAAASDAGDEAAWASGSGGRLTAAEDAMTALAVAATGHREELGRLLSMTGGGGLVERPRIAVTSAVTGALLALTDLPGLRRNGSCARPKCRRRPASCDHDLTGRPGLGPPPPTDGYTPGAALDRFVRARDRRCRFPGCRRPVPCTGELDHDTRYPDGPTSSTNLVGYCTANHRGKHQAPGWRHQLADDGILSVTTPTGLVAVTEPPPY